MSLTLVADKTVDSFEEMLNPIQNYVFENDDIEYYIEPIVSIIPLLIGTTKKGNLHLKKEIYNNWIEFGDENTESFNIETNTNIYSMLNDTFDVYDERGLKLVYHTVVKILKETNLYQGNIGGFNLSGELNEDDNPLLLKGDIYDNFENREFTLSEICDYCVDFFNNTSFNQEGLLSDLIKNHMTIFSIIVHEEESSNQYPIELLKFIKIILDYFIHSLRKDDEYKLPIEISGDIIKDVSALSEDFLYILKMLQLHPDDEIKEDLFYSIDKTEKSSINSFEQVYKYNILGFSYAILSMQRTKSIDDLKEKNKNELGDFNKDIKKLKKEIDKLTKKNNEKDKQIIKLNKEVKSKKDKEYIAKIKELENKLKNSESKLISANNRIKSLEKKISTSKMLDIEKEELNTDETIVPDVIEEIALSKEEMLNDIKDFNFFVVGGNSNFFKRLKEVLPNSKHIDVVNDKCNFSVPKSTDCILNMSKVTTHSHIKRAKAKAYKNIPSINLSTYQVDDIIATIYKVLIK